MGKVPYVYTDSDETEDYMSSVESVKKRKVLSYFKHNNPKKNKGHQQSKSEPDDGNYSRSSSRSSVRSRSRSQSRSSTVLKQKLRGILKHTERVESSDDEEDAPPMWSVRPQARCLVGQVPRSPGTRPCRGGGLALVVRRNADLVNVPTTSTKKKHSKKQLIGKKSY